MQKFLFLLLPFLLCSGLYAQPGKQYFFAHFSTFNGLASNQLSSVLQDADGYIWIAGTDGLQRFDGVRFKTFTHIENDPNSIPANFITQLLPYDKDNMWVVTEQNNIGLFNTKTFRYKAALVSIKDRAAHAYTRKLFTDEEGNAMFLYSRTELLTWNKTKNEFSSSYNFIPIAGKKISDITHQPGTKKYWIGTDSGFLIYNKAKGKLSEPGNNRDNEPLVTQLQNAGSPGNIFFDGKGRMWFDYWKPWPLVNCYDIQTGAVVLKDYDFKSVFRSYYEIKGYMAQRDGSIWIKGLKLFARFNEDKKQFELVENGFKTEQGIAYEMVTHLFEDREDNVWVSTSNKGLYRFQPNRQFFNNVPHVNLHNKQRGNGAVMSFAPLKNGHLLAGSWDDGLYLYNNKLEEIPFNNKALEAHRFLAAWGMCLSGDSNTVWIASQPGLYAFNQAAGSLTTYNPKHLNNRTIRQVIEDKNGSLWLGMHGSGLYKWEHAFKQQGMADSIKKVDAIPSAIVNKLVRDKRGFIWIATGSKGLFVIDPGSNKLVLQVDSNSNADLKQIGNAISTVMQYNDSVMVITTPNRIFCYNYNNKQVKAVGNSNAMSGYIAAVEKDSQGFLWVATTNGLYRVNMAREMFTHFSTMDGISDNQFALSSSVVLPDGRLIFGSSELVAFSPDNLKIREKVNQVKITEFMVRNTSLQVDSLLRLKEIRLDPGDNSLLIEFSTLMQGPSHAVIKYKLEDIDADWKYSDNTNRAVYSYLPPGNYTFMVMAENANADADPKITTLFIEVQAHFWQTWWFYGVLILLAATLFFWFDKERMRRKEDLLQMRENIAGNLHQEINTALSNINILSEMAKRKADSDPAKSKDYIEQIHAKSGYMMTTMDDVLWSIDPMNDSMQKTLERIRQYTEALHQEHGIETELWVDKKVSSLSLDMKSRYEAFQLLKEILSSLEAEGKCKVHVGLENGKLHFIIQYENAAGDMEALSCLAQKTSMQKRLESAGAEMEIQVHKNHCLVELEIPV